MGTNIQIIEPGAMTKAQPADLAIEDAVTPDRNPALVYLASLSPGSRRTMRQALDTIADLIIPGATAIGFPWAALRFQHTQAIRSELMQHYSAATTNKMLSALRQTLDRAIDLLPEPQTQADFLQVMALKDELRKAQKLAPVKGEQPDQAAGRAVEYGELLALMNTCCNDPSLAGVRDAALLAIAYACGLRRAELAGLDVAHFDGTTLTVQGKRNKTRTVPVANGALDALQDWLAVRGREPGPLFVRIRKGDKLTEARLTTQAIYFIFQKRAEDAGVDPFSPHDLRRTFIGDLLDAGADLSVAQKLAGHANVSTTAGYDRRGERAKREAVKKLHVPYKRRNGVRG